MRFVPNGSSRPCAHLLAALFFSAALGAPALAQSPQGAPVASAAAPVAQRGPTEGQVFLFLQNMPAEVGKTIGPLINALLSDTSTAHMEMAARRSTTREDSARAAGLVVAMRSSLQPYADVNTAVRDGYQKFMPWMEKQVIYHYNNMSNARAAATAFDATKPTSLLYRKDEKGAMRLIGAMYTAPASSSPEQLDARLPLGVAYWHRHVNFCARRPTQAEIDARRPDSALVAKALKIETREECAAMNGMFIPQLFGWMAHVNVFDGDAMDSIWGAEGRDHMAGHSHHEH